MPFLSKGSLSNDVPQYPRYGLGRWREQLILIDLADRGFARSGVLLFRMLLTLNIQISWARSTSKL